MLAVIASVLLSAAPAIAHTGCNTPRHFSDSTRTTSLSPAEKVTADDIIREAKKYIGRPYRRDGFNSSVYYTKRYVGARRIVEE